MIRDPLPVVVAYDLQAALIRCGIKVEDKEFAYAACRAMENLVFAWLFGVRKVAAEQGGDEGSTALALLEELTVSRGDNEPWRQSVDHRIAAAVKAVGFEGRDFCARFGWGLNFPPPRDLVEANAVNLDPPCAHASSGCLNALPPGTGYAAVEPFPRQGWRPAYAGHGLTAAARRAQAPGEGVPASTAAKTAEIASASVPAPSGEAPRMDTSAAGDSTPRNWRGDA